MAGDVCDVFISHRTGDLWSKWIGRTLAEAGCSVHYDLWDLAVGAGVSTFQQRPHRVFLMVLTSDYLDGRFTSAEYGQAYHAHAEGDVEIVPILVDDKATIPEGIRHLRRVELPGKPEWSVRRELLDAIRPHREGPASVVPEQHRRDSFPGPSRPSGQVGILHLADLHALIELAELDANAAAQRFAADADLVAKDRSSGIDLITIAGGLTPGGLPKEFDATRAFIDGLTSYLGIPARDVLAMPGPTDVNINAIRRYLEECEENGTVPIPPYAVKWAGTRGLLTDLHPHAQRFTPDVQWYAWASPTLPDVTGIAMNTTMALDHTTMSMETAPGALGERQLIWSMKTLADRSYQGFLRFAVGAHPPIPGRFSDHELRSLHPASSAPLIELFLTGGGLGVIGEFRTVSAGVPSQGTPRVQVVTTDAASIDVVTLRFEKGTGHLEPIESGDEGPKSFARRDPSRKVSRQRSSDVDEHTDVGVETTVLGSGQHDRLMDEFAKRVRQITEVLLNGTGGGLIEVEAGNASPYLRVARHSGTVQQWVVGMAERPRPADVENFASVARAFRATSPHRCPFVVSDAVYDEPQLLDALRGVGGPYVELLTISSYSGDVGLRAFAERHVAAREAQALYPTQSYLPQRYRLINDRTNDPQEGALEAVVSFLTTSQPGFALVLAEFGTGKTYLMHELARRLVEAEPNTVPLLINLRSLSKATDLNQVLAQYIGSHPELSGLTLSIDTFRSMVEFGNVVLLFDGYDELENRLTFESAKEHFEVLLSGWTQTGSRARVVLTSRREHFLSDDDATTRSVTKAPRRLLVELLPFDSAQVRAFLVNHYGGNEVKADARLARHGEIHDLAGLSENPRMLSFIADLTDAELDEACDEAGTISAASLYRELIAKWMRYEDARSKQRGGRKAVETDTRLHVVRELAVALWQRPMGGGASIKDLSERTRQVLDGSATDMEVDETVFAVGSGSLLVRHDDEFSFLHRSLMEFLVAEEIAAQLRAGTGSLIRSGRVTDLMVEFLRGLLPLEELRRWSDSVTTEGEAGPVERENARMVHVAMADATGSASEPISRIFANEVYSDRAYGGDYRGGDFSGTHFDHAIFTEFDGTGADFRGASLRHARVGTEGPSSLRDAALDGADLTGAVILDRVELANASVDSSTVVQRLSVVGATLADAGPFATSWFDPACARLDWAESSAVNSVAWRPRAREHGTDGLVAVALASGRIRLFDAETGHIVGHLDGHTSGVNSVGWSPDSTRIVSAGDDETVRVWDVGTGRELARLDGHTNGVNSVGWSPDSTRIVSAGNDKTVRVWDVGTGRELARLDGHTNRVNSVGWSPDSTRIVSAGADETVRVWDVGTGRELARLDGHTDGVNSVGWSPDSTRIVSAGDDETVRVWGLQTSRFRPSVTGRLESSFMQSGPVHAVSWSPDCRHLVVGGASGTIDILDAQTGRTIAKWLPGRSGFAVLYADGAWAEQGTMFGELWWSIGNRRVELHDLETVGRAPIALGSRRMI